MSLLIYIFALHFSHDVIYLGVTLMNCDRTHSSFSRKPGVMIGYIQYIYHYIPSVVSLSYLEEHVSRPPVVEHTDKQLEPDRLPQLEPHVGERVKHLVESSRYSQTQGENLERHRVDENTDPGKWFLSLYFMISDNVYLVGKCE